jgi:hypothetical protein
MVMLVSILNAKAHNHLIQKQNIIIVPLPAQIVASDKNQLIFACSEVISWQYWAIGTPIFIGDHLSDFSKVLAIYAK